MSLFLITFLTIYGGMHLYVFQRLRSAFALGHSSIWLLAVLMVLMTVAPILVRFAEQSGHGQWAIALAWIGYVWMGAIFLLAVVLLTLDTLRGVFLLVCHWTGYPLPALPGATITCAALVLALGIAVYSFVEARTIRSEHLTIPSSKLPSSSGRIRIVQISDVHLGLVNREARLKRIIDRVNAARPDILVSTGDLVDGRLTMEEAMASQQKMEQLLADVRAPLGKFAITGNHEFYAGIKQAVAFTTKAGFRMLRGESVNIGTALSISGVDDPAALRTEGKLAGHDETDLLRGAGAGRVRILLKHRPDVAPPSDGLFDLQLSGHTHDGQIFPFGLLVRLHYPVISGTITTKSGSRLHISRGSGTWGPPMRFLAPPEVTIIDIVPTKPQTSLANGPICG